MNKREAAQRLVALLNELGAEGIQVEAGAHGVLCLSTDRDYKDVHILPVGQTGTIWEVE